MLPQKRDRGRHPYRLPANRSEHATARNPSEKRRRLQESLEVLRELPLRSDSCIRYVDGTFIVRSATSQPKDLPHCATRHEVLIQLHLNRTATVRDLVLLSASKAAPLDLGYAIRRRYAAYQRRRLGLLKEGELISAARIVAEGRGIRMQQVVNTHMLVLKLRDASQDLEKSGLTPAQQKMHAYTMRYHGKMAEEGGLAAERDGCRAKVMKEYRGRYRTAHDYLGCVAS